MTRTTTEHFISADTVVWTESQPRGKMRLGFPSAHVESHFTYERLGNHHVDTIDSRQIYSRDALQFIGEVELWIILVLLALLFLSFLLSPVAEQYPQNEPGVSLIAGRTRRFVAGRRRTS